jgi:hypothetical protein
MVSRLDIIAEILLNALAATPEVPPGVHGFVYRIVGGEFDGQETLIEARDRAVADCFSRDDVGRWGSEDLIFVREQVVGATPHQHVEAVATKRVRRPSKAVGRASAKRPQKEK